MDDWSWGLSDPESTVALTGARAVVGAILVVSRFAGLLAVLPWSRSHPMPVRGRLALAIVLAAVTLPVLLADPTFPGGGLPEGLAALGVRIIAEAMLGATLGLGVVIIMGGLRLAGEMVDRQSGWGLAGTFGAGGGDGEEAGPGGRTLVWVGVAVLLTTEPIGGHLQVVSSLLESFRTLPVGVAVVSTSAADLLVRLVHQSLLLAVQVVAPVLAVLSLVTLLTGILGRSQSETSLLVVAMPARVLVCLIVLGLAFSGTARAVVDTVPGVLDQFARVGQASQPAMLNNGPGLEGPASQQALPQLRIGRTATPFSDPVSTLPGGAGR